MNLFPTIIGNLVAAAAGGLIGYTELWPEMALFFKFFYWISLGTAIALVVIAYYCGRKR